MNETKTTKIIVDNVGQQNARAFWQQFDNMQDKINNLQSKIDKAIEYIENFNEPIEFFYTEELLNILKVEE